MIARAAHAGDRKRDGIEPGWAKQRACPAFQFGERVFEAAMRGRTPAAIGVRAFSRIERGQIGIENGRGAVDGCVHRTEMLGAHAPGMGRGGFVFGFVFVGHGENVMSPRADLEPSAVRRAWLRGSA